MDQNDNRGADEDRNLAALGHDGMTSSHRYHRTPIGHDGTTSSHRTPNAQVVGRVLAVVANLVKVIRAFDGSIVVGSSLCGIDGNVLSGRVALYHFSGSVHRHNEVEFVISAFIF